jgi:hypothetical protein
LSFLGLQRVVLFGVRAFDWASDACPQGRREERELEIVGEQEHVCEGGCQHQKDEKWD